MKTKAVKFHTYEMTEIDAGFRCTVIGLDSNNKKVVISILEYATRAGCIRAMKKTLKKMGF